MMVYRWIGVAVLAAGLMGCAQPSTTAQSNVPATTAAQGSVLSRGMDVFGTACLDQAPRFDGAEAAMNAAGVQNLTSGAFPADADIIGSLRTREGKTICGITMRGNHDGAAITALKAAMASRGLTPRNERPIGDIAGYAALITTNGADSAVLVTRNASISGVRITAVFVRQR